MLPGWGGLLCRSQPWGCEGVLSLYRLVKERREAVDDALRQDGPAVERLEEVGHL